MHFAGNYSGWESLFCCLGMRGLKMFYFLNCLSQRGFIKINICFIQESREHGLYLGQIIGL